MLALLYHQRGADSDIQQQRAGVQQPSRPSHRNMRTYSHCPVTHRGGYANIEGASEARCEATGSSTELVVLKKYTVSVRSQTRIWMQMGSGQGELTCTAAKC